MSKLKACGCRENINCTFCSDKPTIVATVVRWGNGGYRIYSKHKGSFINAGDSEHAGKYLQENLKKEELYGGSDEPYIKEWPHKYFEWKGKETIIYISFQSVHFIKRREDHIILIPKSEKPESVKLDLVDIPGQLDAYLKWVDRV